jgi:diguanylate cyclase (GGDEF)-like protein
MISSESTLFQRALNDFALESGSVIVVLLDQSGMVLDYNKGFESVVRPVGDPRNRPLMTFLSNVSPNPSDILAGLPEGAPIPYQLQAWGGQHLLLHAYPCPDEQVLLIGTSVGEDDSQTAQRMSRLTTEMANLVRELRRANRRIQEIANRDGLTELPNRRYFMERLDGALKHAQRHARPLSVLIADLDHFKRINDRFGHAAGDAVLREFASLLQTEARAGDLPGRLGGEEFALILPDTTTAQAVQVGERIRTRLLALRPGEIDHVVTVSIGVSTLHGHDTSDALLARADKALYDAKDSGRNRVMTQRVPQGNPDTQTDAAYLAS